MANEMWTLTASGSNVDIVDLGITVNGVMNLFNQFDFETLQNSDDLRKEVGDGTVILNDGLTDLDSTEGVNFLKTIDQYHLLEKHYTKVELVAGTGTVHWNNLTDVPEFGSPSWKDPVKAKVLGVQATPPGGAATGDHYVDTDDNVLYKYNGATWDAVAATPTHGNRVIDLSAGVETIYEYTNGTGDWTTSYTPSGNDAVMVSDNGDGKGAQYIYVMASTSWVKIADVDWGDIETHLDGGAGKHDASEIDVEGTYSRLPTAPTDLESIVSTINTSLNTLYVSAGASWNPHLDGGANKHDADEVDVEGTYTHISTGDLETAISNIDDKLESITVSADAHVDGGPSKHDASEIDVEGTYTYISTSDLETAMNDIDTKLESITVSADAHVDGGANKHDASEVDVEGTYTHISTGDLETAISNIDDKLESITVSADAHVDGGPNKHDASEIDVEGTYTYISTSDLETAMNDIDTKLESITVSADNMTLDEIYNRGHSATVDAGAVILDASGGNYAPLQLTDRATAPSVGSAAGQLSVVNGLLYAYDAVRSKWLSVQRMFLTFGRRQSTRNQYLNFGGGGTASNQSGYRMPRNATIVSMSAQLEANAPAGGCTFEVRKNDAVTIHESIGITAGNQGAHDTSIAINYDFTAGDYVQSYLSSTNLVEVPVVIIEIAWIV